MPDVSTPLKQLILRSLDKNQWSCTCDLYPLARFLRNYIKSSARMLRNAKDLNCQPSTMAAATTNSVLRLSETNCDSKAANLTLVLKDRSSLFLGQDVALLTVLGFAGMTGRSVPSSSPYSWDSLNDAFLWQLGSLFRACRRETLSAVWEDASWFGIGCKNFLLQRNCLTQRKGPWARIQGLCVHAWVCAKSLQSCLTLCGPVDYCPPGSSVHGILQSRIPEWGAISSSRGSSQSRDQTGISYFSRTGRRVLYH